MYLVCNRYTNMPATSNEQGGTTMPGQDTMNRTVSTMAGMVSSDSIKSFQSQFGLPESEILVFDHFVKLLSRDSIGKHHSRKPRQQSYITVSLYCQTTGRFGRARQIVWVQEPPVFCRDAVWSASCRDSASFVSHR